MTITSGRWIAGYDLGAMIGRVVGAFALFSVIMPNVVRVLLFELKIRQNYNVS